MATLSYRFTVNEWIRVQKVIGTHRLELHHICAEDLVTLFEEPEDLSIYEGKSYSNPYRHLMDDKGPLAWRVPQVKEDPALNRWFVRWIVLRSTGEIIGSTSFHGAPNSDGMIEIGLGIHEGFRNLGYAKESLLGMWRWAMGEPQVEILRYTVGVNNAPSIHVIESLGFHYQGEQIDEEDGPESIFEMSRNEFLVKFGAE
jgi:ribosomal-protein-alanine N-acetyltransferase